MRETWQVCETQKRAALKVQLRFRKTILQQEAPESLYRVSSKEKGQYNSELLRANLIHLLAQAASRDPLFLQVMFHR